MRQSSTINYSVSDAFEGRQEVKDFISSINIDLSNRIKKSESAVRLASEEKNNDEYFVPDFSNRKLGSNSEKHLNYYSKTQKWLGHVSEINEAGFVAKLEDLTNKGTWEYGEFDWEEVSEEDKPLAKIGSAFYWWIGFIHENGQIGKTSQVRFQRVLQWDEAYLNSVEDRKTRLMTNLKWE